MMQQLKEYYQEEDSEENDTFEKDEQEGAKGLLCSTARFLERTFPGDQDRTEQESI